MPARPLRTVLMLLFAAFFLLAPNASAVMFGAHTDGAIYDGSMNRIDSLQHRLERRIGIAHWYQQWGGNDWVKAFHPDLFETVTKSDRVPLLTWEPWDPAAGPDQPRFAPGRIAAGDFDDYLERWARGLRRIAGKVYLRPMHEMNGDWYPWGGRDPGAFRAAWRHIHEVFDRVGADNVRWVWCVNNYDTTGTPMERFYPGRKYVDVLAMDGYNWGSTKPEWGGWQSFRDVFQSAFHRLRKLGDQPIWIAEVGSAPEGGDKAQWVRGMWETARHWDRLKAIVWFDLDKERDWRAGPVANAFSARR